MRRVSFRRADGYDVSPPLPPERKAVARSSASSGGPPPTQLARAAARGWSPPGATAAPQGLELLLFPAAFDDDYASAGIVAAGAGCSMTSFCHWCFSYSHLSK